MQANLIAETRDVLQGKTMSIPIAYRKRPNARRYILRINTTGDGGCVTVPRGGNLDEAQKFARRNLAWLEQRLAKLRDSPAALDGNSIYYRGNAVPLTVNPDGRFFLGEQMVVAKSGAGDLRSQAEHALRKLAATELPIRAMQLAELHGLRVERVSVRNQRSRWGSCSARRVISLNWRLIQAPEFVRDYIIVHELMHLREMNHSHRFWKLVYDAFPQTPAAERWLKSNSIMLRR